jgi:hypothetical protein
LDALENMCVIVDAAIVTSEGVFDIIFIWDIIRPNLNILFIFLYHIPQHYRLSSPFYLIANILIL